MPQTESERIDQLIDAVYSTGFVDGQNYMDDETKDEEFVKKAKLAIAQMLREAEQQAQLAQLRILLTFANQQDGQPGLLRVQHRIESLVNDLRAALSKQKEV